MHHLDSTIKMLLDVISNIFHLSKPLEAADFKKAWLFVGTAVQFEECLPSMYKVLGLVPCTASNQVWDYCVSLEVDERAQGWR